MPNRLLSDKRLIFYLFIALRLTLLLVYQPYLINTVERGLSTFGDFQTYFNFAALSSNGQLPYRDFWYEFPPIFPLISLAAFALSGARYFTAYATVLGVIISLFDLGNLWLIGWIGRKLHGEQAGLGLSWIYGLLAAPLVLTWWTFEPIVTFSILISVAFLIEDRDNRSALGAAFGALTKLWPLAMIAVVARFRTIRQTIRYGVIAGVVTVIGLAILLGIGGRFGVPSLVAQFNKASYETVWALIDGNYKTGNFGGINERFDPTNAYSLQGNPAVVPAWARLLIFGGIGLLIYARTRRFDGRGIMAFTAITITLFFLWAQGWSPQWQTTLIPLILLNFPTRAGVLSCLALSLVSFIEYPVLFMRTGETSGVISGAQLPLFAALVIARTILLAGFAFALYRVLRQSRTVAE